MSMTQADLQAALDAQASVITEVQAEVVALQSAATAPDLTPQVTQLNNQTAELQALLPAPAAPAPAA